MINGQENRNRDRVLKGIDANDDRSNSDIDRSSNLDDSRTENKDDKILQFMQSISERLGRLEACQTKILDVNRHVGFQQARETMSDVNEESARPNRNIEEIPGRLKVCETKILEDNRQAGAQQASEIRLSVNEEPARQNRNIGENAIINARIPRGGWLKKPLRRKYFGRTDAQNPMKFLNRFERIASYEDVKRDEQLYYFGHCLKGTAAIGLT